MSFFAYGKRIWPWLLLFLLSFSVFFACLCLNQLIKIKVFELVQAAEQMGIAFNDPRLAKFPPSLKLASIEISVKEKILALVEPDLELELFPPGLRFSTRLLGGVVHAFARLEWGIPPRISMLNFNMDDLLLPELMKLASLEAFTDIDSGNLSGSGKLDFKYKKSLPDWSAAEGTANFNLKNGALMLKLPILREKKLSTIRGNFQLRLQAGALLLESCRLTASPIFFEAKGKLAPCYPSDKARLQLNTELRIPPDIINSTLIPERTMTMIRQKGMVRTRIAGSLLSPKIYLEN